MPGKFIPIFSQFFILITGLVLGHLKALGAGFSDVTISAGVDYLQSHLTNALSDIDAMSGGAAIGDFDNDGWPDIYVTRLDAPGLLFHNKGDGTFEEVSASAGLNYTFSGNGAVWADVNNDGNLDLFVTAVQSKRWYLFINDGHGHFTEEAGTRGLHLPLTKNHNGAGAAFCDFDRDGWLDLYVTEYGNLDPNETTARLFRNLGPKQPGVFVDVTEQARIGIPLDVGRIVGLYGFMPLFADMDDDGWPDLMITGDFGSSRLFWNDAKGGFIDGTLAAGVGTDENGMGSAVGDYDGDGKLDWFVTSIFDASNPCQDGTCSWGATGNRLYRYSGNRRFSDQTDAAGVRDGSWGWGTVFADFDNRGTLDLCMVNGMQVSGAPGKKFADDPMRFWQNNGGKFVEKSASTGLTDRSSGKALAIFDYDRDGDLDLFVVNNAGHPVLYRNDGGNTNHWLRVKLNGTFSNKLGIGSRLKLTPKLGGKTQIFEMTAGNSYLSQNESVAHFGLGLQANADLLTIRWPSGIVQTLTNLSVNSEMLITEPDTTYNKWRLALFSRAEMDDQGIAGDAADPDGDGLANLAEFAFLKDPKTKDVSPALSGRVQPNPTNPGQPRFVVNAVRRYLPRELSYILETSPDLTHWFAGTNYINIVDQTQTTDTNGVAVESISARLVNGGSKSFVRMRITKLSPN